MLNLYDYLRASYVAQQYRTHLPMEEAQVRSLHREDLLEKGMATLPGESHGQESLAGYSPWCSKESDTTEVT